MRACRNSGFATRLWIASLVVLALAPFPGAVAAFTFERIGNGSGQSLTWFWATIYFNCTANGTCGDMASADGKIPESYYLLSSLMGEVWTGGRLDWTASQGQLRTVAVPIGWASVGVEGSNPDEWTEGTARIDARTTPLVFRLVGESGDPPTTHLRISPRLDGGVYLEHWPYGPGSSLASLELFMSVEVDGQQVSRDSLVTELVSTTYTQPRVPVAFPNHPANVATVPATPGTEVAIRLWAYERVRSTGKSTLTWGESSYGQGRGPAIIVDVQTVGPTGVGEQAAASGLGLGARPNPFHGASRISYALTRPTDVRLSIYDLTGARVATLVDHRMEAGGGEVVWAGRDSRGVPVAPGMYLVELVAGAERARSKLVVLGR